MLKRYEVINKENNKETCIIELNTKYIDYIKKIKGSNKVFNMVKNDIEFKFNIPYNIMSFVLFNENETLDLKYRLISKEL